MNSATKIKCIVWDLDNTIWNGVLLESDEIELKPQIVGIIRELDSRGILHSIASKNDYESAMQKLKQLELDQYFLYPAINWSAKSHAIRKIRDHLNIGLDAIMFIDDQPFEREEVKAGHPEVICFDASQYLDLLADPRLQPRFITEDSKRRRLLYLEENARKQEEERYEGPKEEFLASLNMALTICRAQEEDLERAEELSVRTNQLNSTGRTYDYEQLNKFRQSDKYELLLCELTDRFGTYGKIGLALLECFPNRWHIKLLLMSCRVMSRGIGTVFLTHIMQCAKREGKQLFADFQSTDRNRMMYVTYKFANFKQISSVGENGIVFANDLAHIQAIPPYIDVRII